MRKNHSSTLSKSANRAKPWTQLSLPLNLEPSIKKSKPFEKSSRPPESQTPAPLLDENVWENEITEKLKGLHCPDCGSANLGMILYGLLPQGNRRLNHLTRVQLLIPGGRVLKPEDLYCNECSTEWVSGKKLSITPF